MRFRPGRRPQLTSKGGWLIQDCQVLCFRQSRWERDVHLLEVTTGERLSDQEMTDGDQHLLDPITGRQAHQ